MLARSGRTGPGRGIHDQQGESIGRKGAKLWFRDTLRAARHQSSDPDDLGPMEEFADLKADLYLLRQERKEIKRNFGS